MATKLLIKQNGQISELSASQNAVAVNANARTHFQLVDDAGNLVRHYNSRMVGDKLLIDLPDTAGSPDFIINNYTTYFGSFPIGNTGTFGASDAAASVVSTHVATPAAVAPSAAETAVEMSAPVKASTVSSSSSSGFPTWGAIGLGVLGVAGVAAAVGGGGSDSDSSSTSSSTTSTSGSTSSSGSTTSTSGSTSSSGSTTSTSGSTSSSGSTTSTSGNTPSSGSTTSTSGNTSNSDSTTSTSGSTSNSGSTTTDSGSKTTVDELQKDVLHGNKIVLPTAYTKDVLYGSDLSAITKAATGGTALNQYKSSTADKAITIADVNNLSREVQTELSLFVAELLNPIRQKWGVGLYQVTNGAMNFAQDVANEYTSNNKSIFNLDGHYVEGITRAAANYGLKTTGQFYENLGGITSSTGWKNLTLDDLKHETYDTIVRMLFKDEGSDHGHAKSLLNRTSIESQNDDVDYLGIDASSINPQELNIHIISATDNAAYITNQAKFANTIETGVITGIPISTSKVASSAVLDEDNSYLATQNLAETESASAQITQKFVFSKLLDGGIRQLSDEYDAEDVLVLDNSMFTALSEDKSNLTQHIHYETTTGKLQYDADGEGGEPAVVIAQLPAGLQENQLNFEVI